MALIHAIILNFYETQRNLQRPMIDVFSSLLVGVGAASVLSLTLPYILGASAFPRTVFLIGAPLTLIDLILIRLPLIVYAKQRSFNRQITVVAKNLSFAKRLADLLYQNHLGSKVIPVALDHDFQAGVLEPKPDILVICPDVDPELRAEVQSWCLQTGVEFYVIPNLYEVFLRSASMSRIDDFPVFSVSPPSLTAASRIMKRILDLSIAFLGLIISLPLVPIIAILIKLDSPGPILYSQQRVGEGGRLFSILKFRTMFTNAERKTGPVLATANDPRITRVGRFLRKTRLDELPQLWNVLIGEMSLVGPRPERPEFVQEYENSIPLYGLRHRVKPGITGLAQVVAKYDTDVRDKLRYDLMYIAEHSILFDIRILAMTVKTMVIPGLNGDAGLANGLEEKWMALIARQEQGVVTKNLYK
jgi:exopolysaccharide biosynthesis polyprenyl glycosylphosphotransferase